MSKETNKPALGERVDRYEEAQGEVALLRAVVSAYSRALLTSGILTKVQLHTAIEAELDEREARAAAE